MKDYIMINEYKLNLRFNHLVDIFDTYKIKSELKFGAPKAFKLGELKVDNVCSVTVTKDQVAVIMEDFEYDALRGPIKDYIMTGKFDVAIWDEALGDYNVK